MRLRILYKTILIILLVMIFNCKTNSNIKNATIYYRMPTVPPPATFTPRKIETLQDIAINYQRALLHIKDFYLWYNTNFKTNYYKINIESLTNETNK